MKKHIIATGAICGAILAGALSASAVSAMGDSPPMTVADQAKLISEQNGADFETGKKNAEEYSRIIAEFPFELAADYSWPVALPKELADPDSVYEDGFVEGLAINYWVCTWSNSTLEALDAGDIDAVDRGLAMLSEFGSMEWTKNHFPDYSLWYADVVQTAKSGNSKNLRESTPQHCGL